MLKHQIAKAIGSLDYCLTCTMYSSTKWCSLTVGMRKLLHVHCDEWDFLTLCSDYDLRANSPTGSSRATFCAFEIVGIFTWRSNLHFRMSHRIRMSHLCNQHHHNSISDALENVFFCSWTKVTNLRSVGKLSLFHYGDLSPTLFQIPYSLLDHAAQQLLSSVVYSGDVVYLDVS